MNKTLETFLNSTEEGVYYPGHASAIVRINSRLIALDPLWNSLPYGHEWKFLPEQIDCNDAVERFDACFISHEHQDHYSTDVINRLRCPVSFLMGPSKLRRIIGKCTPFFQEWAPYGWKKTLTLPGIEFYFVPHENKIDSCVFIRNAETGYTVFHGNDYFFSHDTLNRIRDDIPRVDIAMLGYACIHYYPALMTGITEEEREREQKRMNDKCLNQAKSFIRVFNPEVVIPIGASLYYNQGMNHPLNKGLVTPWDLHGAHPMFAGDYILGKSIHRRHMTKHSYFQMLMNELGEKEPEPLDLNFNASAILFDNTNLKRLTKKITRAKEHIENHVVYINGIAIDLNAKAIVFSGHETSPFHSFNFDKKVFMAWINEDLDFEEAIGTRRFQYTRNPNEFRPDVIQWVNKYL